jgi:hypothetical protein
VILFAQDTHGLFATVIVSLTGVGPEEGRDSLPGGAWIPPDPRHLWYNHHPRVEIVATTADAECQLHDNNILVLEPKHHRYMVAVVDEAGNWEVARKTGGPDTHAIPGGTLLTPFVGTIERDPFAAAQARVQDDKTDHTFSVDEYGLPYGNVPTGLEDQWTFLGRYRSMAQHGGGFTYCYLYRQAAAVVKEEVTMTTDELRQALLEGRFQEIAGAATMSLALQHYTRNDAY